MNKPINMITQKTIRFVESNPVYMQALEQFIAHYLRENDWNIDIAAEKSLIQFQNMFKNQKIDYQSIDLLPYIKQEAQKAVDFFGSLKDVLSFDPVAAEMFKGLK